MNIDMLYRLKQLNRRVTGATWRKAMHISLLWITLLLSSVAVSAQVKINEVMPNPLPDSLDPRFQTWVDCANDSFGTEYVEIYNSSECDTIDLGCYIIGFRTSAFNSSSYAFRPGQKLAPLDFLVIGGSQAPNVDVVVSSQCGGGRLCGTPSAQLDNNNGWVAIYNAAGDVEDAVYWTEQAGQIGALIFDPAFQSQSCVPADCTGNGSLKPPDQMSSGSEILYAGKTPAPGLVIARDVDGTGIWQTDQVETPDTCNGQCSLGSDLIAVFDSIEIETCQLGNGYLGVSPIGGTGPYEYIWSTGDEAPFLDELKLGQYFVTVIDAAGCQFGIDTFLDNIGVPVVAEGVPEEITIFNGESTQISVTSPNNLVSYDWSPVDGLSCTTCESPVSTPISSEVYTVDVVDDDGCEGSATVTVNVLSDEQSVFVPNIFTPNGDGLNDVLFVRSPRLASMSLFIYDRWGEEVFTTRDVAIGWVGKDKAGNLVNTGVYAYYLEVVFDNGQTRTISGNITVVR